MAEGEADALRECTVPQRIYADGIAEAALRPCGSVIDDQIGDGGTERGDALRRNNVAQAGNAATLRQNFKQTGGDFDAAYAGTAPEGDGILPVAPAADAKRCNAIDHLRAQAHVGRNTVETERAAAIDRDRDFGREPLGERAACESVAQVRGQRCCIDNLLRVETS